MSFSKLFAIFALVIIGGGYVQGNIISIQSTSEYTLALTEALDVLIIKKYSPIEIICKAPEKGKFYIYGDKIFFISSNGLYLLENKSFKPILKGNVSIVENYILFNGSLYVLPQFNKISDYERVIIKNGWALVIHQKSIKIYYRDISKYVINASQIEVDPQKIVDFYASNNGIIGIVESSGNVSVVKNNTLLSRITFSEKRSIKVLDIFNESLILSIKDSTFTLISNYTQIVAIYSLNKHLFKKFYVVKSIYYPYAFSGTYVIDLRSGEVFLDNILSVLDYKNDLMLLSLKNNTLALVNVSSGKVLYSYFPGFPYTGSIINESLATVVTRVLKYYNYVYVVSFPKSGERKLMSQPQEESQGFNIKYIIPFIFFGSIPVLFYIFFLRRPKIR